eukprot:CAMPEP_0194078958 /NCGR_PEP_ID=MMETSP0149-20130528/5241_1 /TAXON_ID=122233 /ORGANISM="Chaetoceros debilis, Strain MM31A-1" /LENGTH=957 /DNA_ID=CAMNT_0038760315 /DNA_START=99 /DNA_END=2972 /DNA_ORIENTATION=+
MLRKLTSLRISNVKVLLTTFWIFLLLRPGPLEVSSFQFQFQFQYSKSIGRDQRNKGGGGGGGIDPSISILALHASSSSSTSSSSTSSYIETIRCRNFGGLINANRNRNRNKTEIIETVSVNSDVNVNVNGDINGSSTSTSTISGSGSGSNGMFFASKNGNSYSNANKIVEESNDTSDYNEYDNKGNNDNNDISDNDIDGSADVVVHLGEGPNLVAVTGETGSGKSLLVVKVIEFIMGIGYGSKAAASMIPSGCDTVEAELVIKLSEPYITVTKIMMEGAGVNSNLLSQSINENGVASLSLSRTTTNNNNNNTNNDSTNDSDSERKKPSIKSIFKINGKQITMKAMKLITSPLIAIVDAAAAATALAQPKARMDIIDTAVKGVIISRTQSAKKNYREARRQRERIEREIANRILPSSFASAIDDGNEELLQHWLEEIDDFEVRMETFQDSILSSEGTATLLSKGNNDFDDEDDSDNDEEEEITFAGNKSFVDVLKRFADCSWSNDSSMEMDPDSITSSYYTTLLDLRDGVSKLDAQLASAHAACDILSSLSLTQSAAYAIEQSRNHLFDVSIGAGGGGDDSGKVSAATEESHNLLNQLEDALNTCTRFMEDDSNGLISTLEKLRQSIHLSVDDIDVIVGDWGALSRKHGINSFSMPSLQRSLRQELDGNIQAKQELPDAKLREQETHVEFQKSCKVLSEARAAIAGSLSLAVTERIKSLGMDGSTFQVILNTAVSDCADASAYADGSILGVDAIDFLLLHRQIEQKDGSNININGGSYGDDSPIPPPPQFSEKRRTNDDRGGYLEVVGSSGEKARILLAIETELPGSIASCGQMSSVAPVAVVYDEIDAHVGGRAAVALAKLLAEQTRSPNGTDQIISITHSPSVAAVADRHIVIQKLLMGNNLEGRVEVIAKNVEGSLRREELSRMASGDLASDEEGLRFAEALLRQGQSRFQKENS